MRYARFVEGAGVDINRFLRVERDVVFHADHLVLRSGGFMIRQQFDALQKTLAMTNGSMFGYVAAEAAYRGGAAWFDELKQTVWENYTFARDYLAEQLPQAVVSELQGTYLMWIDLGAYLAPAELEDFFQHRCRLAVDYGHWFGKSGQTMVRLNLATSRENVQTAVTAIARELKAMGRA